MTQLKYSTYFWTEEMYIYAHGSPASDNPTEIFSLPAEMVDTSKNKENRINQEHRAQKTA